MFALAYRMLDPLNEKLIDFEWFKFLHHKAGINKLGKLKDQNNYLYPNKAKNRIFIGDKSLSRVWHYHDKEFNVRTS